MERRAKLPARWPLRLACLGLGLLLLVACGENMSDRSRLKPHEPNAFFPDGQSARPLQPNTVARGFLRDDEHFYSGTVNGELAETLPMTISMDVLRRGQERYNVFCAPCHALDGGGDGMIVLRGFPVPPSFHEQRLRDAPVGHYFDVITNGYGVMFPYGYRVDPPDRWAIIAYIRALQLSQGASVEDVPPEELEKLQGSQ